MFCLGETKPIYTFSFIITLSTFKETNKQTKGKREQSARTKQQQKMRKTDRDTEEKESTRKRARHMKLIGK